jgi:hypothetical protein
MGEGVKVTRFAGRVAQRVVNAFVVFGMTCILSTAGDLSKYRNFQLGSNLQTIARQTSLKQSEAKVIHSRPVLIQNLEWRAQPTISSSTESPKDLVFSFYEGELFRIVVRYDRHEIEGLTADDMIEAISRTYGVAVLNTTPTGSTQGRYGDEEEILARWEDANHHFDLVRSSYGGRFSLLGVLKRLEEPAQIAVAKATELDVREAPERDIQRIAKEREVERAKLEKARFANKPKFQP